MEVAAPDATCRRRLTCPVKIDLEQTESYSNVAFKIRSLKTVARVATPYVILRRASAMADAKLIRLKMAPGGGVPQ